MENIAKVNPVVVLWFFAILSINKLIVNGQLVETYPREITVGAGQNATILCKANSPLTHCRFEIPGMPQGIPISDTSSIENSGLKYFGRGLDEGECGVSIERVSLKNHGKVKCALGLADDEAYGEIGLTVAVPPSHPEIQYPESSGRFQIDQDVQFTCISRNGRPPAQLNWFLGDEQLFTGVLYTSDPVTSKNVTLYTATSQLNRRMRVSDDRKFLVCRSIHPADQPEEDRLSLQVKYRPQPVQETRIHGFLLNHTALVNVTIMANPRPRIEWAVDGKRIREGSQIERYEAYQPIDLGNNTYNITLAIAGLTIADTTKTYYLKAANEFGQQDYSTQISSLPRINSSAQINNGISTLSFLCLLITAFFSLPLVP